MTLSLILSRGAREMLAPEGEERRLEVESLTREIFRLALTQSQAQREEVVQEKPPQPSLLLLYCTLIPV